MPLTKRGDELWFFEDLYADVSHGFRVMEVLVDEETRNDEGRSLHRLMILKTPRYGKVLVLDGVVQTTEADEYFYHEPLVHIAVLSCFRPPAQALLIGCDGGTLREAVKHASLLKIDVVDIDRKVADLMDIHIPSIPSGAFQDPRVTFTIADGARFVRDAAESGCIYDVVIVDSPDPVGPAQSLFRTSFYLDIARILAPEGVVIRQTGSSALQPDEMPSNVRQMLEIFPDGDVQVFVTAVPSYIGGYFTFVAASPSRGLFMRSLSQLKERFRQSLSRHALNWYSPAMHRSAMVLTPELQRSIDQAEYGRELVLDLYGCDPSVISSSEKLRQFAGEICAVIGMKPYGEPLVPDFGFAKSKTAGPSLVQLIETSAVTAHYSPHWRMVLKNIFTCSTLDAVKAVEFTMKFFDAMRAKWRIIVRGGRLLRHEPELLVYETSRDGDAFTTETVRYARVSSVKGIHGAA